MIRNIIENGSKLSLHNRHSIENSNKCGCYYCKKIFDASSVKMFIDTDDTALCPMCGTDSVLADNDVENINVDLLEELNHRWF